MPCLPFESSVNSEGIETALCAYTATAQFESSVNSEGIETAKRGYSSLVRLRAV